MVVSFSVTYASSVPPGSSLFRRPSRGQCVEIPWLLFKRCRLFCSALPIVQLLSYPYCWKGDLFKCVQNRNHSLVLSYQGSCYVPQCTVQTVISVDAPRAAAWRAGRVLHRSSKRRNGNTDWGKHIVELCSSLREGKQLLIFVWH